MKYYGKLMPFQPVNLHRKSILDDNLFLIIISDRTSQEILHFLHRYAPIEFDILVGVNYQLFLQFMVFFIIQIQLLENVLRIFIYLKFFNVPEFIFYLKDWYFIKSEFIFNFVINVSNDLLFMEKYILTNSNLSIKNPKNFLWVINVVNLQINSNLKN